jgi:hypothetical protein
MSLPQANEFHIKSVAYKRRSSDEKKGGKNTKKTERNITAALPYSRATILNDYCKKKKLNSLNTMLRTVKSAYIKFVSGRTYSEWRTLWHGVYTDVQQLRNYCRPYTSSCSLCALAKYGFHTLKSPL